MGARYYSHKKDTVEDCKAITTKFLKDHNYFQGYMGGTIRWSRNGEETGNVSMVVFTLSEDKYIELYYYFTDNEKEKFNYRFSLTTTKCNFGGKRYWFVCGLSKNGTYCGKRVGTLYKAPGAKYFGCRHCMNLSYESRNENRRYRNFPLFRIIDLESRQEELYKKLKRKMYRGIPTKKMRQIMRIDKEITRYAYLANIL